MSAMRRQVRSGAFGIGSRPLYEPALRPDVVTRPSGAEDLLELERRGLLELVVAAVLGTLVGSPALERGGVPEPIALEVVVGDLGNPLRSERLPGQVLAAVPARRRAGKALAGGVCGAPLRPL